MSLQTPTTIRSRPNKLYGKAKATPIGRRRGPAVKSVGKPDALIGHVRFDERGRETERLAKPQAAAPFLDSTIAVIAPVISLFWTNFFPDNFPVPIPALLPYPAGTAWLSAKKQRQHAEDFRVNR